MDGVIIGGVVTTTHQLSGLIVLAAQEDSGTLAAGRSGRAVDVVVVVPQRNLGGDIAGVLVAADGACGRTKVSIRTSDRKSSLKFGPLRDVCVSLSRLVTCTQTGMVRLIPGSARLTGQLPRGRSVHGINQVFRSGIG